MPRAPARALACNESRRRHIHEQRHTSRSAAGGFPKHCRRRELRRHRSVHWLRAQQHECRPRSDASTDGRSRRHSPRKCRAAATRHRNVYEIGARHVGEAVADAGLAAVSPPGQRLQRDVSHRSAGSRGIADADAIVLPVAVAQLQPVATFQPAALPGFNHPGGSRMLVAFQSASGCRRHHCASPARRTLFHPARGSRLRSTRCRLA